MSLPPAKGRHEAQAKSTFPFLKLPGEIRNKIDEIILLDVDFSLRVQIPPNTSAPRRAYCNITDEYQKGGDRDDLSGQDRGSVRLTQHSYSDRPSSSHTFVAVYLFQVCKQFDQEAAPLFYGRNLFSIYGLDSCHVFLE